MYRTPTSMTQHSLRPIKGWFQMAALDKAAKIAAGVTIDIFDGRVMHLNSSGELETGVRTTRPGIFMNNGNTKYVVNNPGTTSSGGFMHQPIAPTGVAGGLVALGPYEVESTEFDPSPATPFAIGQLLTAKFANADQATGGVLSNDRAGAGGSSGAVRQYVDPVCGIVTSPVAPNEHGVNVLKLWTTWLPAAFA